jgi:hypothetical protein
MTFKSSDRIRRAKHEKNYTVILNSTIQDSRLSWKARGLHHYLLSLPDDWDICIAHLSEQSLADGRASLNSALKELETLGYLFKSQPKNGQGKFEKYLWFIYETPQTDFQLTENQPQVDFQLTDETLVYGDSQSKCISPPQIDFPQADKPQADKPQAENQQLINTYIQSNNLQNTEDTKLINKTVDFVSDDFAMFEPFRIVWNENAPSHWRRYKKLDGSIVESLKKFTKKYKGESIEIFVQGLQYVKQDKFYGSHKVDWAFCQYLTNDKPFKYACEYRQNQDCGDGTSETAEDARQARIARMVANLESLGVAQ